MSTDTLFDLSDLETGLSAKKPKAGSSVKPRTLPLRSTAGKSGKRKAVEMVNLDSVDDASVLDLARALVKSVEKLNSSHEELEIVVEQLRDQKKALEAEAAGQEKFLKRQDKEIIQLKKKLEGADAMAKAQVDETIHKAMKSATVSVLQAKIKMANEANSKGVTLWDKELKEWRKSLEGMTGKKASIVEFDAGGKDKEVTADEARADDVRAGDQMEADAGGDEPSKEANVGDECNTAQT